MCRFMENSNYLNNLRETHTVNMNRFADSPVGASICAAEPASAVCVVLSWTVGTGGPTITTSLTKTEKQKKKQNK